MIVSYCITAWLAIGSAFIDKSPVQYLPTSTNGCNNDTFSNHIAPGYLLNVVQSNLEYAVSNESAEIIYRDDYPTNSLVEDLELDSVSANPE